MLGASTHLNGYLCVVIRFIDTPKVLTTFSLIFRLYILKAGKFMVFPQINLRMQVYLGQETTRRFNKEGKNP